jgi:biopolymer transport protein ExbD
VSGFNLGGGGDEPLVRKRTTGDAELDLTSMIDVVFLLLIFFMVTSTMQQDSGLDLPAAKHGVGVESLEAIVITVNRPAASGDDPPIVLSDGTVGTVADVRADVERGFAAGREDVIIKADRDILSGFVTEVMRAASEVEGVHIHVQVKDKK